MDLFSPEVVFATILAVLYGLGLLQDKRRKKRGARYRPSPLRPVKRFKMKMRGWHLKPESVSKVTSGTQVSFVPKDKKNWIRIYPNPGYRLRGKHWCRGTHKNVIEWPVEEE